MPGDHGQTFKCAFCDGSFEIGQGDLILICPYCGTSQTNDGTEFKEHYMIRVGFKEGPAKTNLLDWISKHLGVPADFKSKAVFEKQELVFYPFWVSNVNADTSFSGMQKDANFYDMWLEMPGAYKNISFYTRPVNGSVGRGYEFKIPGASSIMSEIQSSPIPTRAKEYFSHDHTKEHNGRVVHSNLTKEMAEREFHSMATRGQTELIYRKVEDITSRNDNIDIIDPVLLHVPIWQFKYRCGSKVYEGYISGSTGYVIKAEYPRAKAFRIANVVSGVIILATSLFFLNPFILFIQANIENSDMIMTLFNLDSELSVFSFGCTTGVIFFVLALVLLHQGLSRSSAKERI